MAYKKYNCTTWAHLVRTLNQYRILFNSYDSYWSTDYGSVFIVENDVQKPVYLGCAVRLINKYYEDNKIEEEEAVNAV